jgi:hypothetical protein
MEPVSYPEGTRGFGREIIAFYKPWLFLAAAV